MTAHNMIWPPQVIPGWDVLKWKDETQAEILRETEGMTGEEVREYFRQAGERFDGTQRHYQEAGESRP